MLEKKSSSSADSRSKTVPTPTPFVAPETPKDFSDLLSKKEGIPYAAWLKSKSVIESSSPKLGRLEYFISPGISGFDHNKLQFFENTSRLFPTYEEPKENYIFIFNSAGIGWVNRKLNELLTPEEISILQRNEGNRFVESNCPSKCSWAKQQTSRSMKNLILIGYDLLKDSSALNTPWKKIEENQIWSHEYFHSLQRIPLLTSGMSLTGLNWPPAWYREGGAGFVQNVSQTYTSYEDYLMYRETLNPRFPELNEKWVLDFLDLKNYSDGWDSYRNKGIYDVGMRIAEIFVALKGPGAIMDLYVEQGRGNSFEQAFETIFGIKWEVAVPIIAKVVTS